ncbi:hypothetical protein SAMN04487983_1002139 [Streptomyces sp. yr375]|nr:hypothetical protein SAMN04487983_1002139 [Streptomyces sp. yr375]
MRGGLAAETRSKQGRAAARRQRRADHRIHRVRVTASGSPRLGRPVRVTASGSPRLGRPVRVTASGSPRLGRPVRVTASGSPRLGRPVRVTASGSPRLGRRVWVAASGSPRPGRRVWVAPSGSPRLGRRVWVAASGSPRPGRPVRGAPGPGPVASVVSRPGCLAGRRVPRRRAGRDPGEGRGRLGGGRDVHRVRRGVAACRAPERPGSDRTRGRGGRRLGPPAGARTAPYTVRSSAGSPVPLRRRGEGGRRLRRLPWPRPVPSWWRGSAGRVPGSPRHRSPPDRRRLGACRGVGATPSDVPEAGRRAGWSPSCRASAARRRSCGRGGPVSWERIDHSSVNLPEMRSN